MRFHHYRRGFTFIELLFVIVIMGIVGGVALEAIRQYYEGIYRTQEYSKRVAEADHILEQLSKYFETAIMNSIVNLDRDAATGCYGPPEENDAADYTVAFVAVDEDSLRGISGNRPGWSEDVTVAGLVLAAADANYTMADTVIGGLFPGSGLAQSAIYDSNITFERDDNSTCSRYNWDGAGGLAGFHTINSFTSTALTLDADLEHNATNGRRKYLIRTGYAFRVLDDGNFTMYSNFRPWRNEHYTAGSQNILGRNVASFYVDYNGTDFQAENNLTDRGLVWRLKVCMRGLDTNLSVSNTKTNEICRERRVHVRY
ncbi:MAG: type II secretion system protein [Sulfuricurvum sp.]|nr:type II secretion system protein [Sulfuricurvum sp.]